MARWTFRRGMLSGVLRVPAVAAALERARAGAASVVVVEGEPGSGKSTLCRAVVAICAGWLVLSTAGVEWEADLPLACLSALLPLLAPFIPGLTPAQEDAVRAAMGETAAADVDAFVLGAALVSLLAAAAEQQPVVVVVDDCHWVDPLSWRTLLFALRRLHVDRVAAVLTARPGRLGPLPDGFERTYLPQMDVVEARALVADVSGHRVSEAVAAALVAGTGGNPLALREAATALSPGVLAGTVALPDPLPVGPDVRTRFGERVARFEPATRRALGVVALAGSGSQYIPLAL